MEKDEQKNNRIGANRAPARSSGGPWHVPARALPSQTAIKKGTPKPWMTKSWVLEARGEAENTLEGASCWGHSGVSQ